MPWEKDSVDLKMDYAVYMIYRTLLKGGRVIEPEPPQNGFHRFYINGRFYILGGDYDHWKGDPKYRKNDVLDLTKNWWEHK